MTCELQVCSNKQQQKVNETFFPQKKVKKYTDGHILPSCLKILSEFAIRMHQFYFNEVNLLCISMMQVIKSDIARFFVTLYSKVLYDRVPNERVPERVFLETR